MSPSARRNIQRGIRRCESPCSESNSQRMMEPGAQSMSLVIIVRCFRLTSFARGLEGVGYFGGIDERCQPHRYGAFRPIKWYLIFHETSCSEDLKKEIDT